MPELISELIWVPIGAKEDADMTLDHFRTPIYNGGMCATLQGTLWRNLPFQCVSAMPSATVSLGSASCRNFSGDAPVVILLR